MRGLVIGLSLVVAWLAVGCGGAATGGDTSVTGSPGTGGTSGRNGEGGGPSAAPDGGGGPSADGGSDVPYRDPGCPPVTRVDGVHECNVMAGPTACAPGSQCVPTVTYGEQCHTEQIGTRCVLAGVAAQGDSCTTADCAPGFVCVTGGSGFECAKLCFSQADCPPGLLCSPLDVDGYGVCG